MRLARKKVIEHLKDGETIQLKKLSEGEFLIYAKKEIGLLFAEAITEKSAEKFGDLIEIINNVCDVVNIDFYESMKFRTEKRFKEGIYVPILVSEVSFSDSKGLSES